MRQIKYVYFDRNTVTVTFCILFVRKSYDFNIVMYGRKHTVCYTKIDLRTKSVRKINESKIIRVKMEFKNCI